MGKLKRIYKNICLNEWCIKEVQNVSKNMSNVESEVTNLKKEIEIIRRNSDDLVFANIFHDTIRNSEWLDIPLSLSSGAICYNFAYILYRILDDIKPKTILEMGLGQSTKIINEYAKHFDGVHHNIVEHDQNWVDFFKKSTDMSEMVNFHLLKNYKKKYNGTELNAYKGFKNEFKNNKFDFICIDGPVGYGLEYSRMDILDILPDCLNKQFVILLDDCERIGEKRTIELLEKKLRDNNIGFCSGYQYRGRTDAYICVSEDLEFLCHI